jgi:hypothetical protein
MPFEDVRSYCCAIMKECCRHGGQEVRCSVFESLLYVIAKALHSKECYLYLVYIHIVGLFDVAYRMAHDDVAWRTTLLPPRQNANTTPNLRSDRVFLPLPPPSVHVAYVCMPTRASTATKIVLRPCRACTCKAAWTGCGALRCVSSACPDQSG